METIMSRIVLRVLLVAAMFAAVSGVLSSKIVRADVGDSLVYLPLPETPSSPGECGRDCLNGFVDKYFDAMISRCACNVPMAPGVKYTENGLNVQIGEGIWKTITRRGTYRVYLADPSTGEAGYYGDFSEALGALQGMIVLRLKVQDHRVSEIEVLTFRQQLRPRGGLGLNTAGVMTPRMINELDPKDFLSPNPVLFEALTATEGRNQMTSAVSQYFDGFNQNKGSLVPFDKPCSRRENGVMATDNTSGPVVDPAQPAFHVFSQGCAEEVDRGFFGTLMKARDARPLVIDERQGLVLEISFSDNEGNLKSVAVPGVGNIAVPTEFLRPISYMQAQLFKIQDGKIRQIEGLSWAVPFGMPSGWDK
jgi:hypothetical protein